MAKLINQCFITLCCSKLLFKKWWNIALSRVGEFYGKLVDSLVALASLLKDQETSVCIANFAVVNCELPCNSCIAELIFFTSITSSACEHYFHSGKSPDVSFCGMCSFGLRCFNSFWKCFSCMESLRPRFIMVTSCGFSKSSQGQNSSDNFETKFHTFQHSLHFPPSWLYFGGAENSNLQIKQIQIMRTHSEDVWFKVKRGLLRPIIGESISSNPTWRRIKALKIELEISSDSTFKETTN